MSLRLAALAVAQTQIGVHEQGGNNKGPEVDEYLRSVGLEPGNAWCAAFLFWCFSQARLGTALVNPVPKVGSAIRVWRLAEPICQDTNPQIGYVYVLDHGMGLGHIGIVESVDANGIPAEISGNTFETSGGRAGNCVARHTGTPELTHGGTLLGYLDFDRAAQAPGVS